MAPPTCRFTDPATGVVAEVRTDGVPVGLALPERLLDRATTDVAHAVLRALTAAASDARELLERMAEEDWDEADWDEAELDAEEGEATDHGRHRDGADARAWS